MPIGRRELLAAGAAAMACRGEASPRAPAATPAVRTAGPDPWIELSRGALVHNLGQLRARATGLPLMAVIKCDAYGHGLLDVARELAAAGVDRFAVGKLDEALRLRAGEIAGEILNLGPFASSDAGAIVEAELSQAVYGDGIDALAAAGRRAGRPARVHVDVDTGLGRVGVPFREAGAFVERVARTEGIRLAGMFTALVEDPALDPEQITRLKRLAAQTRARGIEVGPLHAASSAALLELPEAHLDLVRPGIALYGHYPDLATRNARPVDLRPVLTLGCSVVQVKTLAPGDSVGYHRAFVADAPTRVATLPLGYSDGLPPGVVGKAPVLIRGRPRALVGVISANHCVALVDDDVAIGDEAIEIGRQGAERAGAEALADAAGISEYKLLIGLGARISRRVVP
jgi:alanine racemase